MLQKTVKWHSVFWVEEGEEETIRSAIKRSQPSIILAESRIFLLSQIAPNYNFVPFKYAYKKEHLLRADGSHPYPASARRNKKFPDISYFPKIFKMSYGRQRIQNM